VRVIHDFGAVLGMLSLAALGACGGTTDVPVTADDSGADALSDAIAADSETVDSNVTVDSAAADSGSASDSGAVTDTATNADTSADTGTSAAFTGYTLYGPDNGNKVYLIDMSGTAVHTWTGSQGGYANYLLEDGSVIRPKNVSNSTFNGGGSTGGVERLTWSGSVAWSYSYSSTAHQMHHDIEPLPSGNVLVIAWEAKTATQVSAAGGSKAVALWPDSIVEIQPSGASGGTVVWEWHAWDHLIQHYDSTKASYGVIADHPELLELNMTSGSAGPGGGGGGDWLHLNAVSYNPELDQIAFSSHYMNEVYVIDHSTTTAEAASHAGGKAGKGGDILYRWGNPSNYGTSGTKVFNIVHCAWWIPTGLPGAGHLMAFNNNNGATLSQPLELELPLSGYGYTRTAGAAFGPGSPVWSYTATGFYSDHLGGVQRLPNGNTLLIESTDQGQMREVTSAGAIVWTFNPKTEVARGLRYAPTYAGLSAL
jgi:hypothetical protein